MILFLSISALSSFCLSSATNFTIASLVSPFPILSFNNANESIPLYKPQVSFVRSSTCMRDTCSQTIFQKFSFTGRFYRFREPNTNTVLYVQAVWFYINDWYRCNGYDSAGTVTVRHTLQRSSFDISSSNLVIRTRGQVHLYLLRTKQQND